MCKKKICAQCGHESDMLYGKVYCRKCYADIWDKGFEVTTQWGDEIGHRELNMDLDEDLRDNPQEYQKTIAEILAKFEKADWECKKCQSIRLSEKTQVSMTNAEIADDLLKPCPGCGTTGYLHHYFKG